MLLDIPTLIISEIAAATAVGTVFATAGEGRTADGGREAMWAAWCQAAAFAFMLGRELLPAPVGIVLTNTLLWLGLILQWLAYRRFDEPLADARRPLWALGAVVVGFSLLTGAGAGYRTRAIVVSLVIGLITLLGAWQLRRGHRPEEVRSRRIGIVLSTFTALCQLARVGLLWASPVDSSGNLLAPALERTVAFLPTMLYTLGTGLGFLMMQRERSEAHSRTASLTDALTGCANRRAFEERCRGELAHARRTRRPLSLIVVDIDHFKRVNDAHGHPVGDAAIRHLADVLTRGVRASDVVARFGGEEFCVLLREADEAGAALLADRLRCTLRDTPVSTDRARLAITASFGVATAEVGSELGWEELFRRADGALYRAKQAGRNRVETSGDLPPTSDALSAS
jgi:diguanylate cyclase (GGDEF)-like protein